MPQKFPFPTDPVLTAISIGYRNRAMIADQVLPRVPVGKKEFRWWEFDQAEGFTVPNTLVGRTSRPNQVEFSAAEKTSSVIDYGLEDPIPQDDIDNAPPNHDPRGQAVEGLTDLIALDREARVAKQVFDPATYPAGYKEELTGTDKWSDFDDSDPIGDILEALETPLMRPNVAVMGQPVWTRLSQHPQIVKAVHGNSGDSGIARRQAVAELFELEEILVGASLLNAARRGQTPSYARVWGPHMALIHRDRSPTTRQRATFGFTAEYGTRIAGWTEDKNIGLRGGQVIRVGESVREVIAAGFMGYFFENAVAV